MKRTQIVYIAKAGGNIAGNARKELEKQLGRSVISPTNATTSKYLDKTKYNKIRPDVTSTGADRNYTGSTDITRLKQVNYIIFPAKTQAPGIFISGGRYRRMIWQRRSTRSFRTASAASKN